MTLKEWCIMATFQERFNQLFAESKLSQEEFGRQFKATKSQIFNWRNGRGEPDSEMMKTIAETRDVSVDWLTGASNERKPGAGVKAIDDPEVTDFMKTIVGEFRLTPDITPNDRQEIMEDLAEYFHFKLQQKKQQRKNY